VFEDLQLYSSCASCLGGASRLPMLNHERSPGLARRRLHDLLQLLGWQEQRREGTLPLHPVGLSLRPFDLLLRQPEPPGE